MPKPTPDLHAPTGLHVVRNVLYNILGGTRRDVLRAMLVIGACGTVLPAVAFAAVPAIDNPELAHEYDGTNWAADGRTFSNQHFSPLTHIHADNIDRLGLAWSLDLEAGNALSTPLAVEGVLYFGAGASIIHAVDVQTGKLLWRHDPEVASVAGAKLRQGSGIRGIAFWKGKVYAGTQDGRLIALDARTGTPVWSVMTVPADDARTISGAPRAFNGMVVIGHGGADFGPVRGYVTAYDAETGKQIWRFHTVPGNPARGFENAAMETAAKTWSGEWWQSGGGGAVWNAMTYDPDFNLVYLGTGDGTPRNRNARAAQDGDNLFVSAIVALHADTGKYVWHYQVNPGESQGYDAAMDLVLADLAIGGERRKVLLQASENGFFYVIDRATGKLLSAEKFASVNWAERIDPESGRPVEIRGVRDTGSAVPVWPGEIGAHNWPSMSFNPITRLAYIPVMELPAYLGEKSIATGLVRLAADRPPDSGSSHLLAWDAARQKAAWRAETPGIWNGGTLTTAGNLVFQGLASGELRAYTAHRGKQVWSFRTGGAVLGAPISYRARGQQYVSVLVGPLSGLAASLGSLSAQHGWQYRMHPRRLLTFALDARVALPPTPEPQRAVPLDDPKFKPDARLVKAGSDLYATRCVACHGLAAISGGAAPDLRASTMTLSAKGFDDVVRGGLLETRGMPKFGEMTETQLEALRHYIRAQARGDR